MLRNQRLYLNDILEAIGNIREYVSGPQRLPSSIIFRIDGPATR
jgi:hypothetical protein